MLKSKNSIPVWQIRRGMDRRFKAGHPWVYSNELSESPKGINPGDLVEIRDSAGKFLARGFGNPKSLISFRALTRQIGIEDPISKENMIRTLIQARELRVQMGMEGVSYRLFFGEVDGIPGLVIDRYLLAQESFMEGQVFVIQAHTAGADRIVPQILEILETYVCKTQNKTAWDQTAIVLRNDLGVRKLEGIEEELPRILKELPGLFLSESQIAVQSVLFDKKIPFWVDLVQGQKTGFFLDQFSNIQLAALRLKSLSQGKKLKILDLCSYVGQWGVQLASVFQGRNIEVLSIDASQKALELVQKNASVPGVQWRTLKANVLKDLHQLEDQSFDLVIADPPALIKSRKEIPQGTHAYLQLNSQVFRLVKRGGAVVCCSCSALLEEESFAQILAKAAYRNQVRVRWVGRGGHAPDHPVLSEFPEGRYLKCWIGWVDSSQ